MKKSSRRKHKFPSLNAQGQVMPQQIQVVVCDLRSQPALDPN